MAGLQRASWLLAACGAFFLFSQAVQAATITETSPSSRPASRARSCSRSPPARSHLRVQRAGLGDRSRDFPQRLHLADRRHTREPHPDLRRHRAALDNVHPRRLHPVGPPLYSNCTTSSQQLRELGRGNRVLHRGAGGNRYDPDRHGPLARHPERHQHRVAGLCDRDRIGIDPVHGRPRAVLHRGARPHRWNGSDIHHPEQLQPGLPAGNRSVYFNSSGTLHFVPEPSTAVLLGGALAALAALKGSAARGRRGLPSSEDPRGCSRS